MNQNLWQLITLCGMIIYALGFATGRTYEKWDDEDDIQRKG
jgi:hypothetical protein